jgi:2-isopropylmalate synthase
MSTPNIYGDQIEWMNDNLQNRENICLSLHPHNDRGTAVAASEFGLMAGADRIEGTLFGNGERTGNVDIVTIALNMLTQGIDPKLDFSNINSVMREVEYCNQLPVHPRHPYAGDLVFTAFSGSHQDAIKKGFQAMKNSNDPLWAVPYLPIDPADLGRSYEAVVRINSQSGKGGVAFLLEKDHGVSLPRRLQISMSQKIQKLADESGKEISSPEIWEIFENNFLNAQNGYSYISHNSSTNNQENTIELKMLINSKEVLISGKGNGPIDSFINGLCNKLDEKIKVSDYHQSAISSGSDAKAAAYIELEIDGKTSWGVGINPNTTIASFEAIIVGLSKLL